MINKEQNKFASSILALPINLFFGVLGYINLFIYPKKCHNESDECKSIYDSGYTFLLNISSYPIDRINKSGNIKQSYKPAVMCIAGIFFAIPAAVTLLINWINKLFSSFECLKYINPLTAVMHLKKKIGNSNSLFYLLVTSSVLLAVAFIANEKLELLKTDPSAVATTLISLVMLTLLYRITKENNHHYSLNDSQKIWFFTLSLLTGPITYFCKFKGPNKLKIALIGSSPLILLILFKLSNYITFEQQNNLQITDKDKTRFIRNKSEYIMATDLFSLELWASDFKQEKYEV